MMSYCLPKQNVNNLETEIFDLDLNDFSLDLNDSNEKREKIMEVLKPVLLLTLMVLVVSAVPFPVFAEGSSNTCDNTEKKAKAAEALKSTPLVIKKCLDPTATPLEKLHSCLKPFCASMFIVGCYVSDNEKIPAKVKIASGALCAISWSAYTILEVKHAASS